MTDREPQSNGVLNPGGLAVTLAGLLVTGVGFAVFARMAKQPTATGTPGLMALVSLAVGVVLVEAGSWMNAAFYRSLEKAPYRGWVEIAGGVALILGVLVLGNFLAFYWLGTSAMPVAGIVLGLVLLELALVAEHRTVIRVCTGPAFPLTMIVLGAALLGIVALGLISYINQRHYRRADLTRTGIYTLSDETLKLLMEVKKPLRVISTMVRAARADSDEERPRNFIRGKVGELLEEYQSQSRQIEYIPLDIYANPEAADRLRKELKTDLLADSVTFAYGSGRDAKTKVVEFSEVLAQASPYSRQPPQFKGEDAFTSALQTLLEEKSTKVCFVIGHGEHGIVDYEPVGPGLSAIVERVKGDNCEVKSVTLPEIPDDCDVLVIAGPKMAFRPDEVDAVRNYLTNRQGAGLIVMLDPIGGGNQPSGLEPLLHEHMIEVRTQESIVDIGRQRIGIFVQEGPSLTIECTEYGGGPPMGFGPPSQHQIVRDLKTMRTTFHVACPVASTAPPRPSPYGGPPQGDPFTHELVKTSAQAFSKVDFDPGNIGRLRMDGDKDRNGPFALAIARGLGKGQQPPMQPPMGPPPPQGKIVAFGDSDFISNMYIQRGADGNSTLFRNAIAWAAGKEYKIGIKAKPFHQEAELELPSRQRDFAWWAIVFAPPFHILVIGLVVWWIRRR